MVQLKFNATGFLMVLSASVFSGLRWSLTQILIAGGGGRSHTTASPSNNIISHIEMDSVDSIRTNSPIQTSAQSKRTNTTSESPLGPLTTLYRLSPLMALLFALGSVAVEFGTGGEYKGDEEYWSSLKGMLGVLGLMVFGGVLALCMT